MYTGIPLLSGIITEKTHFIFRSRSTRIVWLVQISKEMYEYDSINNEIYFNKFILKFVNIVFNYWKALNVTHSLTVVYFARSVIYTTNNNQSTNVYDNNTTEGYNYDGHNIGGHNSDPSDQSSGNITYKDYFKVVLENITTDMIDYNIHIKILKKEFWSFPQNVGWNLFYTNNSGNNNNNHTATHTSSNTHTPNTHHISDPYSQQSHHNSDPSLHRNSISKPSDAASGNFLEALNSSLNLLDKHYLDRDLLRTGNSIVVISAGTVYIMYLYIWCIVYMCI